MAPLKRAKVTKLFRLARDDHLRCATHIDRCSQKRNGGEVVGKNEAKFVSNCYLNGTPRVIVNRIADWQEIWIGPIWSDY